MFAYDMDDGNHNHWQQPIDYHETDQQLHTNSIASVHSQGPSLGDQRASSSMPHNNWDQTAYDQHPVPEEQLGAVGGAPEPSLHSNRSHSKSKPKYNSGDSHRSNPRGNHNGHNLSLNTKPSYPYLSNSSVHGTRGSEASFPDSQDFEAASADPSGYEKTYRSAPEPMEGYHSYPQDSQQAYHNDPAYLGANGANDAGGAGGFIPPHGSDSFSVSVPSSYGQALSQIDSGHQGQEDINTSWAAPEDVRNVLFYFFTVFFLSFMYHPRTLKFSSQQIWPSLCKKHCWPH